MSFCFDDDYYYSDAPDDFEDEGEHEYDYSSEDKNFQDNPARLRANSDTCVVVDPNGWRRSLFEEATTARDYWDLMMDTYRRNANRKRFVPTTEWCGRCKQQKPKMDFSKAQWTIVQSAYRGLVEGPPWNAKKTSAKTLSKIVCKECQFNKAREAGAEQHASSFRFSRDSGSIAPLSSSSSVTVVPEFGLSSFQNPPIFVVLPSAPLAPFPAPLPAPLSVPLPVFLPSVPLPLFEPASLEPASLPVVTPPLPTPPSAPLPVISPPLTTPAPSKPSPKPAPSPPRRRTKPTATSRLSSSPSSPPGKANPAVRADAGSGSKKKKPSRRGGGQTWRSLLSAPKSKSSPSSAPAGAAPSQPQKNNHDFAGISRAPRPDSVGANSDFGELEEVTV
jgi:hypothetical protein